MHSYGKECLPMHLSILCTLTSSISRPKIDRFYYFGGQIWPTRPKILYFRLMHMKVCSNSQCSRTLLMKFAIESALYDCDRNSCKDWVWSKTCGEHRQMWSKVEHCINVWYSYSQTCLGQSVHNRLTLITCAPTPRLTSLWL